MKRVDRNENHIIILIGNLDDFLHRISVRDTDKSAKTPYAMIDMDYIITYFKLLQFFQRQGNLTASRLIAPQVVFMETVKNLMVREKTDFELMVRKTGMKRAVYRFKNNTGTLLFEYSLQTIRLFRRISQNIKTITLHAELRQCLRQQIKILMENRLDCQIKAQSGVGCRRRSAPELNSLQATDPFQKLSAIH